MNLSNERHSLVFSELPITTVSNSLSMHPAKTFQARYSSPSGRWISSALFDYATNDPCAHEEWGEEREGQRPSKVVELLIFVNVCGMRTRHQNRWEP